MKKNTFYAILFCAMLGSCAVIEVIGGNSQDIAEAEAESVMSVYRESETTELATDAEIYDHLRKVNPEATTEEIEALTFSQTAYNVILIDKKILVVDPETDKIILSEDYDSSSQLAKAILNDNE